MSVTLGAEPVVVPCRTRNRSGRGEGAGRHTERLRPHLGRRRPRPDTIAALPDELPRIVDAQVRASVWVAVLDAVARVRSPRSRMSTCSAPPGDVEQETAILSPVADRIAPVIRAFIPGDLQEVQLARVAETAAAALRHAVPGSGRTLAAARVVAALSADIRLLREWALGLGLPAGLAGDSGLPVDRRGEPRGARRRPERRGPRAVRPRRPDPAGRLNSLKARASLPTPRRRNGPGSS